jgi:hypothetical protein
MRTPKLLPAEKRPAYQLALWTSILITVLGILYSAVIAILAFNGGMTFPPAEPVQLFGGVTTILAALLLPVLFGSLHFLVPENKKIYTLLTISFGLVFTVFVSINRFIQVSIVRLSTLEGNTDGLARFLPYDGHSAMFALEMIGWGVFLSLALFFLGLALDRKGILKKTRWLLFLYTLLGTVSAVCFILNNPLSVIGFAAWGFVLYIATGLLAFSLIKYDKNWAENSPTREMR